ISNSADRRIAGAARVLRPVRSPLPAVRGRGVCPTCAASHLQHGLFWIAVRSLLRAGSSPDVRGTGPQTVLRLRSPYSSQCPGHAHKPVSRTCASLAVLAMVGGRVCEVVAFGP